MKATAWNTGWLFRHLDSQENFVPVTLPHDAMQAEPRTELSANGINGAGTRGATMSTSAALRRIRACATRR